MMRLLIALGTNVGDRLANLERAIAMLESRFGKIERSKIYESAPMYVTDQPAFLNMAVGAWSEEPALDILDFLKETEAEIGRVETYRNGPRVIDLDIAFYGDTVLRQERLEIPHPRLAERSFVLQPLADIDPGFVDPVTGNSIQALLDALPVDPDLKPIV